MAWLVVVEEGVLLPRASRELIGHRWRENQLLLLLLGDLKKVHR